MVGEILQRPPAFSALKVDGKRAYQLARGRPAKSCLNRGPSRSTLLMSCGTTIRRSSSTFSAVRALMFASLGRDLAESLGTAAVMSALERTAIGPFTVAEACDPRELTADTLPQHLLPAIRPCHR